MTGPRQISHKGQEEQKVLWTKIVKEGKRAPAQKRQNGHMGK